MGYTSYSYSSAVARAADYKKMDREEIFYERNINSAMNPYGLTVRESRDSDAHPESYSIIIALDETGSMGSVPDYLVKEGLHNIMKGIMDSGIKDPQILFLGIGDHECDAAPLQVGQFESGDELLEKWLTSVFLEGCGGGNSGESYHLAWYLAAKHTALDCYEKRGQKGILITIGDEPVLEKLPSHALKKLIGAGQFQDYSASQLLDEAMKMYHVFHIHIKETNSGSRQYVMDGWKQLLHDNLIIADRRENVSELITQAVVDTYSKNYKSKVHQSAGGTSKKTKNENEPTNTKTPKEEMML